eukprot:gene5870-8095_t
MLLFAFELSYQKLHHPHTSSDMNVELTIDYSIYICNITNPVHGIRFHNQIMEGLKFHPRVTLVDRPIKADAIFYLPVYHNNDKDCMSSLRHNARKLIVLDTSDSPTTGILPRKGYLNMNESLHFKRSLILKKNGTFVRFVDQNRDNSFINHYMPLTYSLMEIYKNKSSEPSFVFKDIDVLCTLRDNNPRDTVRSRVLHFVQDYIIERKILNSYANQVDAMSRSNFSDDYYKMMFRSRYVVTANPTEWEGDFRLYEAMASGALVFVDKLWIPSPVPFVDKQHLIVYDSHNKSDLFNKLDYYRTNSRLAELIAMEGYRLALKYRRAAHLIDYILSTHHVWIVAKGRNKQSYDIILNITKELNYSLPNGFMLNKILEY